MNDLDRMQQRIDELERRVRDLEARPAQVQPAVIHPPQYVPANPWAPPPGYEPYWYGGKPIITCAAPNAPTPFETYMVGSDGVVTQQ